MQIPDSTRCYLVRTTPNLVEKSIVGVGWSDHDFSTKRDAEDAIHDIDDDYGIGRAANQIRRYFAIEEGDLIVATLPYFVAIGRATDGLFFDSSCYNADTANQRRVDFPKDGNGKVVKIGSSRKSVFLVARI